MLFVLILYYMIALSHVFSLLKLHRVLFDLVQYLPLKSGV